MSENDPSSLLDVSEDETKIPWQDFLYKFRYQFLVLFVGLILLAVGFALSRKTKSPDIEILESTTEGDSANSLVVVEVSGAVENPGVYKLENNARIEDALMSAGGVTSDADKTWIEKFLNRAAKLTDGQKLYIPRVDDQSDVMSANTGGGDQTISSDQGSGIAKTVNINTASQSELETLWGIGPVYAQKIIEQRPYSNPEELIQNGIIKQNVWDRNKDLFSVY